VKRLKGDSRPINSLEHRMAMLAALECVDWVVPFEEDTPREVIARLLPDILVKGGDYQSIDQIAGHDCVLANGGEVKLLGFVEGFSTTHLINKIAGSDFGQHNAGPSQGEGELQKWGEPNIRNI
jgi:D-beta-D-heptose 7-phosphate kinase/D-beta-D-heptose 1-phosphate adenosyltransferase